MYIAVVPNDQPSESFARWLAVHLQGVLEPLEVGLLSHPVRWGEMSWELRRRGMVIIHVIVKGYGDEDNPQEGNASA